MKELGGVAGELGSPEDQVDDSCCLARQGCPGPAMLAGGGVQHPVDVAAGRLYAL
jgi:hypothetical protein